MELIFTSLLVFLLPSQFGYHFWPEFSRVSGIYIDYLSPTLYVVDLLILPLVVIYLIKFKKKFHLSKIHIILIALLILNALTSVSLINTLLKYFRFLGYSVLVSYFVSRPKYILNSLKQIFPYSVILTGILSWLQFYYQRSIGGLWYFWGERVVNTSIPEVSKINITDLGLFLRPYSTFSHPNSLAGFLLVSSLILFYLYNREKTNITLIALIISWITIPLTFSRTIIFLEALVFLVLFIKTGLKYLFALPLFALLFFTGSSASYSQRVSLIKTSFEQITGHPYFGIGFGSFPIISSNHQPVHSLPLLLITELGIPLFLLLVGLLIYQSKKIRYLPKEIYLAWFVIFVSGLLDHYWITLSQNILLIIMLIFVTNYSYKK